MKIWDKGEIRSVFARGRAGQDFMGGRGWGNFCLLFSIGNFTYEMVENLG
jgi:hypothetical protein